MRKVSPSVNPESLLSLDWAALAFRPLVISGLVTCVAAGWILSLEFLLAGWQGKYLIPLVAVVTLEMLLVEQQLRVQHLDLVQRFQIRLAELGVILLVLKPATYLQRGWVALLTDGQQWLRQPGLFLDSEYVIGAMLMLMMWLLAMDIAACLAALQDTLNAQEREWGLSSLKERFMLGAFVLLMAVGVHRVNFPWLGLVPHLAPPGVLTGLPLIYFGLGLLLFGQARLSLLQVSWQQEQVPVTPALARRWASWGLIFVGSIVVLAWLMPGGDTAFGLLLLLGLMMLAAWIGQLLVFILFLLLSLLLAPCLMLFRMQQATLPLLPQLSLQEMPPEQTAGPVWFFYLRLVVFWIVAATVMFLLVRIYWRERQALGGWGIWSGLVKLWQALWAWLIGWKKRVAIRWGWSAAEPEGEPPVVGSTWWQRWQARTARERVRRLYLALLQRAAQVGHPRRPDQTPFEYATKLKPHVTGEENALDTLTSAFVEARYSRREFRQEEVSLLQRMWRRLQALLRKR